MQWGELLIPWLTVVVLVAVYALFYRWLFRRRLRPGLCWLAFGVTFTGVLLTIAILYFIQKEGRLATTLIAEFQSATSFGAIFRLALFYAALPEEAVKIGAVLLLMVLLPRWLRYRSDPAEMLLYSALGFAMCESLLYVTGFSLLPQFKDHLIGFAAMRGIFGSLLHSMLGMVAGFFLARHWRRPWFWGWLLAGYGCAVLLHASFDGSLLYLVVASMGDRSSQLAASGVSALMPLVASSALLLILAVIAIWRSRRLGEPLGDPAAVSSVFE